jgi:hypothetical protein
MTRGRIAFEFKDDVAERDDSAWCSIAGAIEQTRNFPYALTAV